MVVAAIGCSTFSEEARSAAETKWAKELAAFAAADAAHPPRPGGTLFVGSSSFRLWTNLAAAFPERNVINRGFGGSQMHELLALTDQLVTPYGAREIFVYEGDNDLADGKKPTRIAQEFHRFADRVHRQQPETTIYYVAIKPSPQRLTLLPQAIEANRVIAEYCQNRPWLKFVDVASPMLDERGNPRRDFFGPDQLHMNQAGYELWAGVLRTAMASN